MKIEQAIRYLEIYKERYGNLDLFVEEVKTFENDTTYRQEIIRHDCSMVVMTDKNGKNFVSIQKNKRDEAEKDVEGFNGRKWYRRMIFKKKGGV